MWTEQEGGSSPAWPQASLLTPLPITHQGCLVCPGQLHSTVGRVGPDGTRWRETCPGDPTLMTSQRWGGLGECPACPTAPGWPWWGGLLPSNPSLWMSGPSFPHWEASSSRQRASQSVRIAVTEVPQAWQLRNGHLPYFSHFWRLGSPRSRCQQIGCLLRTASWFVNSHLFPASSVVGGEELLGPLGAVRGAIIPFERAAPSGPSHLPKAQPPNTVTVGVRISTQEFGGGETQTFSL